MIAWLLAGTALAESWCAAPIVAHEWGVHVIAADGSAPVAVPVPSWFHDTASMPNEGVPVRDLPPDTGMRALPVVQFYTTPLLDAEVPVAVEVGFRDGEASSWWPSVDRRVPASQAGSAGAFAARARLLSARAVRNPMRENPPVGPDPTKQLGWDHLTLSASPMRPQRPAEQAWVEALRAVPGARWVGRGAEADRFVYYEATTAGVSDLRIERSGTTGTIRNRSDWDVHDVIVIADGRVWTTEQVPHGGQASFSLDRALDRDALVAWLTQRWVDPAGPSDRVVHGGEDCVMMRDPAIPMDRASGHRLYGPELDVLLSVWADRMLAANGSRVLYREDTAALDARMPLAIYTDMYHWIETSRLGVVMVEGGF